MPPSAVRELSDDECGPAKTGFVDLTSRTSQGSSGSVPRPKLRAQRQVPDTHKDKVFLPRLCQSVCKCSRFALKKRTSCFLKFSQRIPALLNLRASIHKLHKLDADRRAARRT